MKKIIILWTLFLFLGKANAQMDKTYTSMEEALQNPDLVYYLSLREQDIDKLSSDIGQLTHLIGLDLSWNNLSELPKEIAQLKNLKEINLSINAFTTFPEILIEMPQNSSVNR